MSLEKESDKRHKDNLDKKIKIGVNRIIQEERPLNLYVWKDVLCSYGCGVMFAYAHNAEHARELILYKNDCLNMDDLNKKPIKITEPKGFYSYGSD